MHTPDNQKAKVQRPSNRLLFVVSEDWYFASHRLDLAQEAKQRGWDVAVACRESEFGETIRQAGIDLLHWEMPRGSLNPLKILRAMRSLRLHVRKNRPSQIHAISLLTVAIARFAIVGVRGIGFVGTIAGLGRIGEISGQAPKFFRLLLKWFARWVVNRRHTWLTVQNADDFAKLKLRTAEGARVRLIPGSGVNPEHFPKTPFRSREKLRFVMLARMIRSKGVVEFVNAIQILQSQGHGVEGHLIGKPDPRNKESLSSQEITQLVENSGVQWFGHTNNPYQAIAGADVICLPTYYGEGIPKILLEAGCVGRPVVACDVPGPRDLVRNGIDGYLVPPQKVDDLAYALERFALEPSIRFAMGDALHKRVLENFSNLSILDQYLELYNEVA